MNKKEEIIYYIINEIKKGRWKEGDKILSESQIMDYFSISRFTARNALNELEKKDIIETQKGKGSFVKTKNIKTKNYIVILTIEKVFQEELKESFLYLIGIIKKYITEKGYVPIVLIKNKVLDFDEAFPDILSSTAGVINMYASENDLEKFKEKKVPVVSTLHVAATQYATVIFDHLSYFNKLVSLIKNHKDILVFSYKQELVSYNVYWDIFSFYALNNYFDRYNLKMLTLSKEKKIKTKEIISALDRVEKTPQSVVFLDDTIFKSASECFPKYDHIFSNTKIISYSSELWNYDSKYPVTQIKFSLDEMGRETVNLLLKIINREYTDRYNIYLKPKIIKP